MEMNQAEHFFQTGQAVMYQGQLARYAGSPRPKRCTLVVAMLVIAVMHLTD